MGLNAEIDWQAFRPDLNRVHEKARKSNAEAKPLGVDSASEARINELGEGRSLYMTMLLGAR